MTVDEVRIETVAETTTVIGRFVARDSGEVAALVGGPVEDFLVDVGDRLKLRDTIAIIDAAELDAELALAEARLAAAEAAVSTANAELTLAQQELTRAEGLKGSSAYSQARSEDARARVAIAQASVAEAEAAVVASLAELNLAQLELSRASVKAPYAGVVLETLTEVGAFVEAGDPLIVLVNDSTLELAADVPFSLLAGLSTGTPVTVELDDGRIIDAQVRAIVPSEDPLTRTRIVRFTPNSLPEGDGLAIGQTAVLGLPTGPSREAVTVHKDAVIPSPQGTIVFVAVEVEGVLKAEARPVKLGPAVGNRFEVELGLEPGDLSVIRGNERLRGGQTLDLTG